MIRYGEHFAGTCIEQFQAELLLDRQPSLFAEMAVQMNRPIRFCDAVFGKNDRLHIACFVKLHQITHDLIDHVEIGTDGRIIRAEALEIIIQVRQINGGERR